MNQLKPNTKGETKVSPIPTFPYKGEEKQEDKCE